jgi:hypothetical protein
MAFLVCYSKFAPEDHGRQFAIYLDQAFYALIFQHCLNERSVYPVLSVVASLRYKSPLLVVSGPKLESLTRELSYLENAGFTHSQFVELRQVCAKAKSDNCSLSITGDMYPEL